jgi:hypothetical protein
MDAYTQFIEEKILSTPSTGFEVTDEDIHTSLFDFQKYAVTKALKLGRCALLEDCGLGKTRQQGEWAKHVVRHTNKPVLILAPLGVTGQTIEELRQIDLDVAKVGGKSDSKIYISNYEQLDNIDLSIYGGGVLDESSILKNYEGAIKKKIITGFKQIPYKLAATATPSPNDDMEFCNHLEFLDRGRREEILAMYFTHDGGETSKWRLKGHAKKLFWDFVRSCTIFFSNPADLGFDGSRYVLPDLNIIERMISTPAKGGRLFNDIHVSATNFNAELRETMDARLSEVAGIANGTKENLIIWVKQNAEADWLLKNIPDAVEVRGTEAPESKEEKLLGFARNQFRVMVTKKRMACFGLNYQNCHTQIDASPDFSFEMTYQAIRRSYRFGQKHPVNYYMITTDTMRNVAKAFNQKREQFEEMKKYLLAA